jgi:AraC-like DNA-binding protein
MPGYVTSTFSEPEDFAAALRAEGFLSLLITARGQFRARLTRVSLNQMLLSAAEEHLPRIGFVEIPSDMVLVLFPIGRATAQVCGGIGMQTGDLLTVGPGEQFHARTDGACHWGIIGLPVSGLIKYRTALTGTAPSALPALGRWRTSRATITHLRRLHAAAIRTTAKCPQVLVDTKTVHGLEQQLFHALVDCLSTGSRDEGSKAKRRGQDVMARLERLLRSRSDTSASIPEVCAALQISERHLRELCDLHLGMSPTTYDRLRRMSLARSALRRADPVSGSVSAVARQNGFRDFGRFAVNYRAAFGESPSVTLHRSAMLIYRHLK